MCHCHFSPVCTLPAKGATFYLDRLAFSLFVNRLAEGQISNRDFVRRSHCGRQMGEQLGRGALRYHAQHLLYHKKSSIYFSSLHIILNAPTAQSNTETFFILHLLRAVNSWLSNQILPWFYFYCLTYNEYTVASKDCAFASLPPTMNPVLCLMTVHYHDYWSSCSSPPPSFFGP